MEIDPTDYPEVKNLPLGATIKVPHKGCSESNAMKVHCVVEGLRFYCHKCGEYHFESSFNSPRERLRRQAAYKAVMEMQADASYDLPADLSHTIPAIGLAWLGRGGWTLEMISKYKIGWSPKLNRVIIPVCPIGYTARAVESWQVPKYLEKVPNSSIWESLGDPGTDICVICEDALSAGRCGEFLKSFALFGTSISSSMLNTCTKYRKVILWLDPDRGGLQGLKKISNRIRMVCDEVQIIHSDKDPKCLTDDEIKRLLT